jgi:hypothetical protein
MTERFDVLGAVEALARAGADVEACTCGAYEYSAPVQHLHPCPLYVETYRASDD